MASRVAQDPADVRAGSPAAAAASGVTRRAWRLPRWRSRFRLGVLCGIVLVLGVRQIINETGFADSLVGPLVHSDTTGSADAIVVMGAGIVGPCEPNLNSMRRVMLATRLFRDRRAPIMLITGGAPSGLPCPVSEVMARVAYELGVPRDAVTLETRSRSTHENAIESAPLLRQLGARRVLIVTDRLHMNRAAGVFVQAGFETERVNVPVYAGHADNVSMLTAGMREYVALAYYRWRGWIGQ